jgi:hypothetical protein
MRSGENGNLEWLEIVGVGRVGLWRTEFGEGAHWRRFSGLFSNFRCFNHIPGDFIIASCSECAAWCRDCEPGNYMISEETRFYGCSSDQV